MTEDITPLDELILHALGVDGIVDVLELLYESRADMIKAIWEEAVQSAPEGFLDGGDGPVMMLGELVYSKITYGDKMVIEAEGVVVWTL